MKQLPEDCGVTVCGPHFKCHFVLIQEKKILKCQCLGSVVIAKCKIQRDKRAPLSILTVRIVKIETEGIINGNIFTVHSE